MDKMKVGLVVKPQGLKGELKVRPLINDPEWLNNLKYVFIDGEDIKRKVLSVSVRFGWAYICLDCVGSIGAAELLRDKALSVLKADGYKPSENEYFIDELIDIKLLSSEGEMLGRIKSVDNFGSADVATAHSVYGEIMFPLVDDIVLEVDIAKGEMLVDKVKLLEVVNPDEV